MRYDTVIANGIILTMNPHFDTIRNGFIAIKNGKIALIENGAARRDADRVIDAGGGVIMPGLINTHTHSPMTLFRGMADDLPLQTWLQDHIFPAEAKLITPDSVFQASLLACAEMLLSGTTTCCDGYFFEDSVAQAVETTGMRGVLGQGVIDFPAPGLPNPSRNVKAAEAFVDKWIDRSPKIRPAIFCHSPYTCSRETLREAKTVAESRGLLFQIHVSETQGERQQMRRDHKMRPIEYLNRLNLLTPKTLLVHAIWVDEEETALIGHTGASVSHNPQSNMKLASGVAPIPRFLKENIIVGLGTDGCASNNRLDLFREMDVAAKLHKVSEMDPTVLDARTVIAMATIEGAKAIGWEDEIGSLEVGKSADIIVIDIDAPHLTPLYSPESHVVYTARGGDVRHVFVAGRQVVKDRSVVTMDIEQAINRIGRLVQKQ